MKPSLTIVIPAYNEQTQLPGCLAAIAAQTEMPDEVIVVDNNSSDLTAAIARKFDFVTLISEPRQGLRFARNSGLNAARGQIIGRIDADTRLSPDWSATARRAMAGGAVDALTGPCFYHDMPLANLSLILDNALRRSLFWLNRYPLLYGSNMVIKRSVWQALGHDLCTRGEFFEDLDMTIHLRTKNYRLQYWPRLVAGVSSRRLNDSPAAFAANMRLYGATFRAHGQFSLAALGARTVFRATYRPLKFIRQMYNAPANQRFLPVNFGEPQAPELQPRPSSNT
ncbi:MAG: glycosyltransferase family 2 protein [Candidatus Saccharimonadales bacterium]